MFHVFSFLKSFVILFFSFHHFEQVISSACGTSCAPFIFRAAAALLLYVRRTKFWFWMPVEGEPRQILAYRYYCAVCNPKHRDPFGGGPERLDHTPHESSVERSEIHGWLQHHFFARYICTLRVVGSERFVRDNIIMPSKVVVLGCAQDGGIPQVGCACQRCDVARKNPGYMDGLVACLALVDEAEGKVFLVDATPNFRDQLWHIQHAGRRDERPLELGGILLTHAHTGHYTGLLQIGKEGADMRAVPVFCTPSMASFLRNNEPWAQLVQRGNIVIRELDVRTPTSSGSSTSTSNTCDVEVPVVLSESFSVLPVLVPHRAELSDTVAYVVTMRSSRNKDVPCASQARADPPDAASSRDEFMKLLYCPDTDGWSSWDRPIRSWCEEVDVALLDATFYSKDELKGRDMSEVSHPIVQVTMAELSGCKAEVVLTHLNHTNPLLTPDSPERAKVLAAGFKVGTFGMEWVLPFERH